MSAASAAMAPGPEEEEGQDGGPRANSEKQARGLLPFPPAPTAPEEFVSDDDLDSEAQGQGVVYEFEGTEFDLPDEEGQGQGEGPGQTAPPPPGLLSLSGEPQSSPNPAFPDAPTEKYRAAILCVLGHVDTGKTSLLDKLRRSNIQGGEAGGITQQMGATLFPKEALIHMTNALNPETEANHFAVELPGLLIIDTPGHASFSAMRTRGSMLCDVAILVVDIMHGLQRQTLESIELLKSKKLPFVIALNKVDRIFGWKSNPGAAIIDTLNAQGPDTLAQYDQRLEAILDELGKTGLNCVPFYANNNFRRNISLVPTSATTGEGVADLVFLLLQLSQKFLKERLRPQAKLSANVLEVRSSDMGAAASLIIVNGSIKLGDTVVMCGAGGPIVTKVRALFLPGNLKEIRDPNQKQSSMDRLKVAVGVTGVKMFARGLEGVMAGSPVLVSHGKDIEALKAQAMEHWNLLWKKVAKSSMGVTVHASTIGSMEALLEFLQESGVPVQHIHIGKVTKRDVLNTGYGGRRQDFRVILAFDVKISSDARAQAEALQVRLFEANIIYHLFDAFSAHAKALAVVTLPPCLLYILPEYPTNTTKPIVVTVRVAGELTVGSLIGAPKKELMLGVVRVIRKLEDGTPMARATHNDVVTITIHPYNSKRQPYLWRDFDTTEPLAPFFDTANRSPHKELDFPREWHLWARENANPENENRRNKLGQVVGRIMQIYKDIQSEKLRRERELQEQRNDWQYG